MKLMQKRVVFLQCLITYNKIDFYYALNFTGTTIKEMVFLRMRQMQEPSGKGDKVSFDVMEQKQVFLRNSQASIF